MFKKIIDEFLFKSDKDTAMYVIFIIKSFFIKMRTTMITLNRNIFNYWEIIVINLCNDFLDSICIKLYKESLDENCYNELKNVMRYINREYFLDSFNTGDSTGILSDYKDFIMYEKKSYIYVLSNIGSIIFDIFHLLNLMNEANLSIIDKIIINIGLLITFSKSILMFNKDISFNLERIDKEISFCLLDFSSNIFIINETNNIEFEIDNIVKTYSLFFKESIKKNYSLPIYINSNLTESEKFESYFLSLIFSFTKYDYSIGQIVANEILPDLQKLKYYLDTLEILSVKRKIYDSKLLKCIERQLLPITSNKNIFVCENLSLSFNDILIFNNFTYNISLGDWISIYGESGCGKTTLCNLILGRIQNYEGSLKFCGSDYDYFDISEHISFVSPNGGIFKRSVRENCIYGIKKNVSDERIRSYLNLFDMDDIDLEIQSDFLSVGQKQRLKIIRLLLHDRPFFFLDEITSNLDKKTSIKVMNEIRKVSHDKIVISITHDRELISKTDKILRFCGTSIIDDCNFI